MGTIDLGGIGVVAGFGSMSLLQGSLTNSVWSQFLDPSAYQSRQETLRYDSPAIHGFIFSASVSEASGGFNQASTGRNVGGMPASTTGSVAAGVGYDHNGHVHPDQRSCCG
jgi:predicted porin